MDKVVELAREAVVDLYPNGALASGALFMRSKLERFYELARADLEAENAKLRSFAQEYLEAWDEGMAGDSYLLRIARAALGENE